MTMKKSKRAQQHIKEVSKEQRAQISKALSGRTQSDKTKAKKSKPVLQLGLDGKLIRRWKSLREAIGEGKFTPQLMRECIAGSRDEYKNSNRCTRINNCVCT